MTWADWIKKQLQDRGLFESDAEKILEAIKSAPENAAMATRWNDSTDNYPPQMQSVVWLSVKSIAFEWIDENQPNAWYKSMFA